MIYFGNNEYGFRGITNKQPVIVYDGITNFYLIIEPDHSIKLHWKDSNGTCYDAFINSRGEMFYSSSSVKGEEKNGRKK